jgi:16S rRNA (guanine1207-N2)-methyltransferase
MQDNALKLLLPELQNVQAPSYWFADENTLPLISNINKNPLLTVITNRYDIYQLALQQSLNVVFSDFSQNDYPHKKVEKIFYRISKEKSLCHHLLNQASQYLTDHGHLVISGAKQEGIKSYADKLKKLLGAQGTLKKHGSFYKGIFSQLSKSITLDDQQYSEIRCLQTQSHEVTKYYSKPGVYGWDKIDKGSELLIESLKDCINGIRPHPKKVMDLGCGYGWLFLNFDHYGFSKITATDNNAAALACAKKNAELIQTPVSVVASDCANEINDSFDLILCNPPFHQGFKHDKKLIAKFISSCRQHLSKNGNALFVVNEFIGIETLAEQSFGGFQTLKTQDGFKIIALEKQ